MDRIPKPRRKVYPWSSELPDWAWGRELNQRLEVIEERRLRKEEDNDERRE